MPSAASIARLRGRLHQSHETPLNARKASKAQSRADRTYMHSQYQALSPRKHLVCSQFALSPASRASATKIVRIQALPGSDTPCGPKIDYIPSTHDLMCSPGQLTFPRPSPTDGMGPRFIPTDDATAVPELPQFPNMLSGFPSDGAAAAAAADEAELRDLLREMRGSADAGGGALPSRWSPMDAAPSLCDVEPTTGGWGSGGAFFGSGGPAAAPFGPADTFQVTDTAGTPFHFPTHPVQHPQQYYMAPPPPPPPFVAAPHPAMMQGMAPPQMMPGAPFPRPATASPWNVAPGQPHIAPAHFPMPPGHYAAFPPAAAYYAPVPPHMMQPMPYGYPFMAAAACAAAAAAPHMAGAGPAATGTTSAGVVPTHTNTSSYHAGSTTDGGSSGDEGAGLRGHRHPAAITAAALVKPPSVSSTDSGLGGLQVVPDAGVMLVPYGGGLMAVPRPPSMAAAMHPAPPSPGVSHASTRAACLARYRQKKAVRSYGKHIRYHMRKVNADKRPRVKGRFIKASAVAAVAEELNNEMDVAAGNESA